MRDLTACLDQLRATLDEVAVILACYRHTLVANGFDEDGALELCLDVQREMICRQAAE
ncbi:MAG TPA: hypothetical protein VG275_06850 [Solirubrobacteraceae bacterium]|jgi:hypothetical protein|nr:hypothetical protein [Solirubrobacteraceae bacterium]